MQRKLGLTVIVFFLSVQLLALLHMAENGFKRHEHHGQACGVYLLSKQSKYCAVEDTSFEPRLDFVSCSQTFPPPPPLAIQAYPPSSPRAPPGTLLV